MWKLVAIGGRRRWKIEGRRHMVVVVVVVVVVDGGRPVRWQMGGLPVEMQVVS
jgi:hypothetical protein